MAILTIAALVVGLAVVFAGTGQTVCPFADWHAFIVVFVGGLAATLAAFPACVFGRIPRLLWRAVTARHAAPAETIGRIVGMAETARRQGILALEHELPGDPFLRTGVVLAVDGAEPALIAGILGTELQSLQERHRQSRRLLETLARNWMVFAGIGVALVLVVGGEAGLPPLELVRQAASPLLQGLLLAGLFAWPLACRLGEVHEQEALAKRMAIEGVMAIQSGDNPRIVEHKLAVFLAPGQRPRGPAAPGPAAPPPPAPGPGNEEVAREVARFTQDHRALLLQELRSTAARVADETSRLQLGDLAGRFQREEIGVVALLAALSQEVRQELLLAMRHAPRPPVEDAAARADFDFGDFVGLTDREIQTLLREVDQRDLVIALKGAAEEVREKFLSNMSQRVRTFITEEIEYLHVHPVEVLETRARMVLQAHRLAQQGQVTLVARN
ncbi:MAG: FliG C-terminal domain-containing protein [Candidatus Latescibacterota bacterium]